MTDNLAKIGNLRQNVVKREYVAILKTHDGNTVDVHFAAESESAARLIAEQVANGEMVIESVTLA